MISRFVKASAISARAASSEVERSVIQRCALLVAIRKENFAYFIFVVGIVSEIPSDDMRQSVLCA